MYVCVCQMTNTYITWVYISKHPLNTGVQNGKHYSMNGKHYMNASSVELCFCVFSVTLSPVGCKILPSNVFMYTQIENNTQYFTVTTNTVFVSKMCSLL